MSSRKTIPEKTRTRLWVAASGRCQYEGCNKPLWRDDLTLADMNTAYIAHIVAAEANGPRGDREISPKLVSELSNLMLMCDEHHRLIDREEVTGHPVERLQRMKSSHEERIELLTSLQDNMKSHVILYGANIGQYHAPVSWEKAAQAMLPHYYPAEKPGIELSLNNSSFQDHEDLYWRIERENLQRQFSQSVTPRLVANQIHQFAVYALGPQPLLMELGRLLSDIPAAEVYQLHREPADWRWQEHPNGFSYRIEEPCASGKCVALNLSLSATIKDRRIEDVLGDDAAIWRLTIPTPNNDFMKSREQLRMFRQIFRQLLDQIKARHGQKTVLNVFPAVPVAVAVEIGRVWMPKADLPMCIYDQNRKLNGFSKALEFPESQEQEDSD